MSQIARKYSVYRFLLATLTPCIISENVNESLLVPWKKSSLFRISDVKLLDLTVEAFFSHEENQLESANTPFSDASFYDRMITNGPIYHS